MGQLGVPTSWDHTPTFPQSSRVQRVYYTYVTRSHQVCGALLCFCGTLGLDRNVYDRARLASDLTRSTMAQQWFAGQVQDVTSGDTVVIAGHGRLADGSVPIKRLSLASLAAPRMVREFELQLNFSDWY
jgi:hypothetical protein